MVAPGQRRAAWVQGDGSMTVEWEQRFLDAYAGCGVVSRAARSAGISPSAVYQRKERDTDFAAAMELALDEATDSLEEEARRRAVEGVPEPVYYQGEQVGTVQKYSDSLLALLLKGRRKMIFSDRTELTGADGAPVQIDSSKRAARIASLLALAKSRKAEQEIEDLL